MMNISNICSLLNKVLNIIKIYDNNERILTKVTSMPQAKIMTNQNKKKIKVKKKTFIFITNEKVKNFVIYFCISCFYHLLLIKVFAVEVPSP